MSEHTFKTDDRVTIHTGTSVYEITQLADDMAKVWPADSRDTRDGFWIGLDQLRPFEFEMTGRMAGIIRSATAGGFIPVYVGDEEYALIGAGLIRRDEDDDYFVLPAGRDLLAAWDAMHGSTVCSTCDGARVLKCLAHIAGDGCDELVLDCPDCAQPTYRGSTVA